MNQLPENMGKKIVEALKKQAQSESETFDKTVIEQNQVLTEKTQNIIREEIDPQVTDVIKEEIDVQQKIKPQVEYAQPIISQPMQQSVPQYTQNSYMDNQNMQFKIQQEESYSSYSPEIPTNVAVLKKLISQLPAGVSKQVGAQIIRQTIEALGISMNSVLQEAQEVQENLNGQITDCTIKMQEYKNQIMQLEANTRDFQRQMAQINDLVNLFVMTDKK